MGVSASQTRKKASHDCNEKYIHSGSHHLIPTQVNKPGTTFFNYPILMPETIHYETTIQIYPENKAYPTAFAFIKEQNVLVAGMSNGILIFTDAISLTEQKIIICHFKKITSLISVLTGKSLISGSKDGILYKHDLDYYDTTILGAEDSIEAMVNLNDGFSIALASYNRIIVYDYMEIKKLNEFIAHSDKIKDMIYFQLKDMLVTCSNDKKIKLWNRSSHECLGVITGMTPINSLICFQRKSELVLVSLSKEGCLTFWYLANNQSSNRVRARGKAVKVIYLENEKNVITLHKDGSIIIYALESGETKNIGSLKPNSRYSTGLYFNDGNRFAFGTTTGSVQLWVTR